MAWLIRAFSGSLWLANCYFTHDSSEFPTPHDELASTLLERIPIGNPQPNCSDNCL